MARRPTDGPTEAELEILHILWQRERATVREVCEILNNLRDTGYTTALKLLQIMSEKGLVKRDESSRSHVYEAAVKQDEVQSKYVGTMLDRLFGGSYEKLLVHANQAKEIRAGELGRIRKLLDEVEKKRGKK